MKPIVLRDKYLINFIMLMTSVWNLSKLSIEYKWVFNIKHDFNKQIERYKGRLVAENYSQRDKIDFNKTLSHVLTKYSLVMIMVIIDYFDLKLYHIQVTTIFLNSDLVWKVYMSNLLDLWN